MATNHHTAHSGTKLHEAENLWINSTLSEGLHSGKQLQSTEEKEIELTQNIEY